MLCDLATVKTFLRISDATQDTLLSQLLPVGDRVAKLFTKRDLETTYYTGPDAEYRDGNGYKDLALWQKPILISPAGLTGTITQNSAVITALSLNAQTYLSVGMPVQVTGAAAQTVQAAFPAGTTILSVDSSTQVTCTANSTASGSAVKLVFGCRVYLDPAGFYGDGTGGFATTAGQSGIEMFLGLNYTIRRDTKGGKSKAALITRLGGGIIGSTISGAWPGDWPQGFLSAREGPYWPRGIGNLKIEYAAGYGVAGSITIPVELIQAVAMIVGFMRTVTPAGVPVDYEALGRQVLMQMSASGEAAPELGTARSLLRPYREMAF